MCENHLHTNSLSSNFGSLHTMEGQTSAKKTAPSSLTMHKNSKTISKVKSKIRIIHIFTPEIIKTDAANFRELVQRLTGKPPNEQKNCSKRSKSRFFPSNKKMDFIHAASEEGFRERVKEEEEIWRDANSGGGFLGGFSEFDQFPFVEEGTSQIDIYQEPQVA